MSKITSKDGTTIAFELTGSGQTVILVDGALCYRNFGPMSELAKLLSPHFTVISYDRRGRGESSNYKLAALEREVKDLDALIQECGGTAYLFGYSSGGCLALETAVRLGKKVKKLAMYEPPYNTSDEGRKAWIDYRTRLEKLLASGRREDALILFMNFVGTSSDQIEGMRRSSGWPLFEALAPTLEYDAISVGEDGSVPLKRAAIINVPTLILNGTTVPFMLESATTLAKAIPHARQKTLDGQRHDVDLHILATELIEFFSL
jgi:pimeloyl-ACP methyl ester carboxylesterase